MTVNRSVLRRGDVVLDFFPFSDLSGAKLRPAVIVGHVQSHELVLAFITSQAVGTNSPWSHALLPSDGEFPMTGLKVPSRVQLDKLATLHRRLVTRRLGTIGAQTTRAIAACLRQVLDL